MQTREQALSQAQLRAVVGLAPDGIFVSDVDGRYTFVNDAACRLLGYSADELIGKTIPDLIPAEDVERLLASKEQMLRGESHVAEWKARRKDGTWLPVEWHANILPDGQWQAFVRDISERKAHEAERDLLLKETESDRRWLHTVLEKMPLAMVLLQPGGRLIFNRRTEELLGMKLSTSGGNAQYAGRVLYADGRPVPQEELPTSKIPRDGVAIIGFEYCVEPPDGSRIPVLGSAAPIRDVDGRVIGAVGAYQDMSERMRMEEKIRTHERLLQGIFDILPVGVWIADKSGRIVSNNPAGERVWKGARYVDVPQFGDYKAWWVETGKPIAPELRTAVRDREEILAIVTHDLRNPLCGLMMGATAAERKASALPGGDSVRRLAASLVDISRCMSGLVDDLLAVAVQGTGGHSMLKLASVPASSVIARATEAARPLLARESLELETNVTGELPAIYVDADRILRVFASLLDNALKFTSPPGRITLAAERTTGGVRFCVANSGPPCRRRSCARCSGLSGRRDATVAAPASAWRPAARWSRRTAAASGPSRPRASACACASCCRASLRLPRKHAVR